MLYDLLLFALLAGQVSTDPSRQPTVQNEGKAKASSIDDYLVSNYMRFSASGSLRLVGSCATTLDGDVVVTPSVNVKLNNVDSFDSALNGVKGDIPELTWTRQSNGLVDVVDTRIDSEILDIRLEQIELKDVVNLRDALDKLLAAPELKRYLASHHVQMPTVHTAAYESNQKVIKTLSESQAAPKVSFELKNVTLKDALDTVVDAFHGVWVFDQCPNRVTLTVGPTGLPNWKAIKARYPDKRW